jgi:hypothetical protein
MLGNSGTVEPQLRPSQGRSYERPTEQRCKQVGRVVPQFPAPSGPGGQGDPRPDLESTGTGFPVDLLVSVGEHRGAVVPAPSVDEGTIEGFVDLAGVG